MSLNGLPPALSTDEASPEWLSKADNAWQLTAATMVGLQSVPGLVILYGSMVKKKWAVNSSFMALYAFAAVLVCWVLWAHNMAFGDKLILIVGKPNVVLSENHLLRQTQLKLANYKVPMADYVFFQFVFAAITVILLAGSLLGRMKFIAWMMFVPLWLTFCYTVGAFSIWGHGFGEKIVIDYAGGYVIHLSSGVAGFTAAYWVGPRSMDDRKHFPPNNIVHVLGGAGFLWLGWTGFNGGSPFAASIVASLAVCNTHLCTATSILIWMSLDMIVYKKISVIGAVQGMITGLVCITPGAGLVDPAAAAVMGILSGSVPWYTMMILHRKLDFFQNVDDTLGVFHTHAVAGALGGLLTGCLARPNLLHLMYGDNEYGPGVVYAMFDGRFRKGLKQFGFQMTGLLFIAVWNVIGTSMICLLIRRVVSLRMDEEELKIGDDAVHGEEAYAVWGDGDGLSSSTIRLRASRVPSVSRGDY